MAKLIKVSVVSTEKILFEGLFSHVIASCSQGDACILPGHAPFLSVLKPGPIVLQKEDGSKEGCYLGGGIIEVHSEVCVLAYSGLHVHELDKAMIEQARQRAIDLLFNNKDKVDLDYDKVRLQLLELNEKLRAIDRVVKRV